MKKVKSSLQIYDTLTNEYGPPIGDRVRLRVGESEYLEVVAIDGALEIRLGTCMGHRLHVEPVVSNIIRVVARKE